MGDRVGEWRGGEAGRRERIGVAGGGMSQCSGLLNIPSATID